ncbi:hypothetical protein H4219_004235 [Mycoemilia scoparia]|uniref:Uncharacterized protein n=1 Tax=Mycoemilia scoparia TaxID=417184 RepID=A0A9W8DRQ0_9FUNG|nr:hypothetical protein H4219_004235 [Mycoemilia scoparia]
MKSILAAIVLSLSSTVLGGMYISYPPAQSQVYTCQKLTFEWQYEGDYQNLGTNILRFSTSATKIVDGQSTSHYQKIQDFVPFTDGPNNNKIEVFFDPKMYPAGDYVFRVDSPNGFWSMIPFKVGNGQGC